MASSTDNTEPLGHLTLTKASYEGIQQCRLKIDSGEGDTLDHLGPMLQHINTTPTTHQELSRRVFPMITDSLPKSGTPTPVTTDHMLLPKSTWDGDTSLLLISDDYAQLEGNNNRLHPALALDSRGRDLWSKRLVALCPREICTELTDDEEKAIKAYEPLQVRYAKTCARDCYSESTPMSAYYRLAALRAFEELEKDSQEALKDRLTASHGDRVTFGSLSSTQKDVKTRDMSFFDSLNDVGMMRVDVLDHSEEELGDTIRAIAALIWAPW